MSSVRQQIKDAILARLREIDGTGDYNYDASSAVSTERGQHDGLALTVWIPGFTRTHPEGWPSSRRHNELTIHIDGQVRKDGTAEPGDKLMADVERALCQSGNNLQYLTNESGQVLLSSPLEITAGEFDPENDAKSVEQFTLQVTVAYPSEYGDPSAIVDVPS